MLADPLVDLLGYAICALGFLVGAVRGLLTPLERGRRVNLVLACLLTAAWAVAGMMAEPDSAIFIALSALRSLAWIGFLAATLHVGGRLSPLWKKRAWLVGGLSAALAGLLVLALPSSWVEESLRWLPIYLLLGLSVLGLLLLENLFRNCDEDSRWGVKWICLGLGLIFVYDFYGCADVGLTHQFDAKLHITWGYVDALAAPLLTVAMIRGTSWLGDIMLSRQVVFHSAVLLGSGAYLLLISFVGTLLRSAGSQWGAVFQVVFLAVAVITMLMAVSSGSFRATLRVLINKHFFRHKYDYREVWLTFIQKISPGEDVTPLESRILRGLADIFECTAGALWVLQRADDAFLPAASWNFGGELMAEAADGPLPRLLAQNGMIIDVEEHKRLSASSDLVRLPQWLADHPRAWLVVPLIHKGCLEAFLVLGLPRTKTRLGWEEIDLLKTLGAQAASYLAEQNTSRALADVKGLEDFNRRFAFVIHDIKNIVGQMALMIENSKRHGANPDFQKDMLATVAHSVDRMRGMLGQLAAARLEDSARQKSCDLSAALRRTAERWRHNVPLLVTRGLDGQVVGMASEDALTRVLDHLLHNAVEASTQNGKGVVELVLREEADAAVIEVRDKGPGMTAGFIRDHLFRPLNSRKADGFGLGAYQARELVRAMGGRLVVDSRLGRGTTMRLTLPRSPERVAAAELEGG